MVYLYTLSQDNDGRITVHIDEIPEMSSKSFASTEEMDEIFSSTLMEVLEFEYRRKGRKIPTPKKVDPDHDGLYINGILQAKILLWNTLVDKDLTASWLSRRTGQHRQEVQRVLDLTQNVGLEKIETALFAFDLGLSISLVDL